MNYSRFIQFAGNTIKFNITSLEILKAVDVHFAHCLGEEKNIVAQYQVEASEEAGFVIQKDGKEFASTLTDQQVLFQLMQDGLTMLNGASTSHLIFHAGALAHQERGLFLCGKSGSGKSTLTAWLVKNGFQYLSDEVIALPLSGELAQGFCRSLVLKRGSTEIWKRWVAENDSRAVYKMNDGSVWIAPTFLNPSAICKQVQPHLIIFPTYSANAEFKTEQLSPANTLFMLMQCLVNARNFDDYGMAMMKNTSQKVSAYRLTYSNIEQASEWIQKIITT